MKHLDVQSFAAAAQGLRRPFHDGYYAMYSSVFDAVVTDPVLMLVPADDHMVHRGDAVFETLKCVEGGLYNARAHLERLGTSATALCMDIPWTDDAILDIVVETVRAGAHRDCLVRILVSRGPGGMGVNPYECPRREMYVLVSRLAPPFMESHPDGATLRSSTIPGKPPCFATIKSCNYVPNALMKKEAVDKGADFVVGFDDKGHMTEGATENVGIVSAVGRLVFPRLAGILRGTTMARVQELLDTLIRDGCLSGAGFDDITREDLLEAKECLVVGTTHNAVAVREFDGQPVGGGKPGPVYAALNELLRQDVACNSALRTQVFA